MNKLFVIITGNGCIWYKDDNKLNSISVAILSYGRRESSIQRAKRRIAKRNSYIEKCREKTIDLVKENEVDNLIIASQEEWNLLLANKLTTLPDGIKTSLINISYGGMNGYFQAKQILDERTN